VDQRLGRVLIDFASQSVYVHFDSIGERVESLIPHIFRNFLARHHAPGVAGQVFQQCILFRRQPNLPASARRRLRRGVQHQVLDGYPIGPQFARTPQESAQPRQQLAKLEGLDQIIVGAGIEAAHAVVGSVTRGEHQNGEAQARLSQLPANLEAIGRGNHDVENGQIVCADGSLIERVFAVGGHIHGIGLLAQTFGNEISNSRIVFYHENAHESFALIHSTSPAGCGVELLALEPATGVRGVHRTEAVSVSNQNSKQEDSLVVSLLSEGARGREEIPSDLGQGRRNFLQQDTFKTLDAKFTALRIAGLNDSV
jgi:hypothetical protein